MRCLLGIILLVSSCKSDPAAVPLVPQESTLELVHSPAVDYPSVPYDEVTLYTVNKQHYKDESLVPLKKEDQTDEVTISFAILDSLGSPAYQNIDRIPLSPEALTEVRSIFHIPENNGETERMGCIAYFRDAFVFYRDKKPVAQAQICFQCHQVSFPTDTTNLEDRFTTDGDWDRLQKLIDKVKVP